MEGEARFLGANVMTMERRASCAADAAWTAVTDPRALGVWFIGADVELTEGGRFEFREAWGGRVTGIEAPRTVTYVADAGGTTTFDITETGDGVQITLTDSMGLRERPPSGYSEESAVQPGGPGSHWAGVVAGWHGFMDALVRYLGGHVPATDMEELTAYYAARLREHFAATPGHMRTEVLTDRDDLLIRRQTLAPGGATPWHTDACHRFSVVIQGDELTIEFQDGGEPHTIPVTPGMADWDSPEARVHRAVNTGTRPFEEVVTFYRDHPGQDPQPVAG